MCSVQRWRRCERGCAARLVDWVDHPAHGAMPPRGKIAISLCNSVPPRCLGRGQIRQSAIEHLRPTHLETLPTALAQGGLSLMAKL